MKIDMNTSREKESITTTENQNTMGEKIALFLLFGMIVYLIIAQ